MRKKQVKLDLIGLKCPIPVLKIAKNIKKINVGDILIVMLTIQKLKMTLKN